jgi:hypothetical protein
MIFGLCVSSAAFAADSLRLVCSGPAEIRDEGFSRKFGVSIDFFDSRARDGTSRKYVLSALHQQKLFQGSLIDKSGEFGEGTVTLSNARIRFYTGSFKLEREKGESYSMLLDGKINNDPLSGNKLLPAKGKLPCVNLSY